MFKRKKNMEEKELNTENQDLETNNNNKEEKDPENKEKSSKHSHKKDLAKIEELGEKLAEINDKYMRLYSEFDNYRKRTAKEKAELIKYAGEDVLKLLLPIIDDFERAIKSMGEDVQQDPFKEGILLIYNKFKSILEQKGVKPILAKGEKFDENLHEAVSHMPVSNENEKGMIVDELERGYLLNDKVIRYSKVVVAV